ncbi:ribonuclease P [Candidatus Micrarchaeota archaeon]|nr:ribonuclease P [Candidatus Micrarchaeota archaeon]
MIDLKKIVENRCKKLLALAKKYWGIDEKLARRYVSLARKISMRHRIKLTGNEYCKKCNTPFIQGKTVKTRLDSKNHFVLTECLNCGAKRRTNKY